MISFPIWADNCVMLAPRSVLPLFVPAMPRVSPKRPAKDSSNQIRTKTIHRHGGRLGDQGRPAPTAVPPSKNTLIHDPLWCAVDALSDPFFELDALEAAAIFSAWDQAFEKGRPSDPFTMALMACLKRQLEYTDEVEQDVDDLVCPRGYESGIK